MDIKSPRLLYLKGVLFLFAGIFAAGLLLAESPTLRSTALLLTCIWCFSRAYYFAFYVIEHYVDPTYRFSGLLEFLRYAVTKRRRNQ